MIPQDLKHLEVDDVDDDSFKYLCFFSCDADRLAEYKCN